MVLLAPHGSSRFANEIMARLRGELAASEVELEVIDLPRDVTVKEAVQGDFHDPEPDIVMLVAERRVGLRRTEEIWLSDRVAKRLFLQRVNADPAEPARSARWVAVQAAELVRARMADSAFQHLVTLPRAEPRPAPPLVAPRELRPLQLGVGFGIGLLHGFGGLGDTWAPLGRASVSLFDGALSDFPLALDLRVTGGWGIERGLIFREQRSSVQQSFGALEAVVRLLPRSRVQPLLAVGGGAYRVAIAGEAAAPFQNHRSTTWSALNSLGVGLRFEPFSGATVVLDATLMDVWSKTILRYGTEDVVQIGVPIALFGATAGVVF